MKYENQDDEASPTRGHEVSLHPRSPHWLWLFPVAFCLHAFEEIRGVGSLHGINLSSRRFLISIGVALVLLTCGIILAKRYGFPQLFSVCLATAILLNAFSHVANSLIFSIYDAGVITGTLIFMPLGIVTLLDLRRSMRPLRYFVGVALGLVVQGVAIILAW